MTTVFLFCAVIGGTILVCQFILTLFGFAGDDLHGSDIDVSHDVHGSGETASPDGHDAHGQHGSTWLFSIVSVRTLVAASTFFGLGGLLAESLAARPAIQLGSGLAMGFAAMLGVHKVLQLMHRLSEDGTVKIQRAVGLKGTVYVPIPANKLGSGKVHVNLQDRLMEYAAVTANGEKLATGAPVIVVSVVGSDTLEVAPVEPSAEQHAA